jgi:hypothetical protein
MIKRDIISSIIADFNNRKDKIITILGPRQVGKSTLLSNLVTHKDNALFLNCDDYEDILMLENRNTAELKKLIEPYDYIFIDEVQRISNVGIILKKIADMHLGKKIAVTGSSSLGLRDKIKEAATGRLIEYKLLPFSIRELVNNSSAIEEKKLLSQRLIYGMYPEAVTAKDDARRILLGIADSYLYKDLFSFGLIKKPNIIQRLVTALALQIGSEVSYNELAGLLGIDKVTVMNYIDLLEKCFIVFSISSLSRNARNELKRGKKIYFYDNGIRNAVISNFANLDLRNDVGALWENFMVSELIKRNYYSNGYSKFYFWRTLSQQEIDFVEEVDGTFKAFEFKWNPKKRNAKMPKAFADAYPGTEFNVIHPDNYLDFLA